MAVRRRLIVKDSNVAEVGYDEDTKTMEVVFKGSDFIYAYQNVDHTKFLDIINSTSVGSAMSAQVVKQKTTHPFTKRTPDEDTLVKSYQAGEVPHNHITRDIKKAGCMACDATQILMKEKK